MHLANGPNDFMADLERKAQNEGLQFIEELVFENGAVYKGRCRYSDLFRVFARWHETWPWGAGLA